MDSDEELAMAVHDAVAKLNKAIVIAVGGAGLRVQLELSRVAALGVCNIPSVTVTISKLFCEPVER